MVFLIKCAFRGNNNADVLSGFVSATNDEERELLALMVETFNEVPTYNGKFTSNERTLLFKSVEIELLKKSLEYISKNLEVPFKYVVAKNFVGDKDLLKKHFKC